MNKKIISLLILFAAGMLPAQELTEAAPQMADAFRQDGKIYVVIAVLSLIFLAIISFLLYLERKISKLENKVKHQTQTNVQK